jgi:hypothetical protein
VLKGVGYALGGAVIIFGIFMNSQRPADFNSAVQDMSLGILALGALTKSIETVMNVGMGNWMRNYAVHNDGRLAEFAGDLAKWFSKNGEVVPVGRCGKFFTAIFGDNAATFFAKRMAPALAIMGLVLCSVSLFHAIQSGNTADIVFDSLFVFFALADSTLMFLSMGGFAWAGALGFGVAIAGLILVIVNILYNILVPKPDPVKDFVHGPMKAKGFAV